MIEPPGKLECVCVSQERKYNKQIDLTWLDLTWPDLTWPDLTLDDVIRKWTIASTELKQVKWTVVNKLQMSAPKYF